MVENSVRFSENFSDGVILEVILLESRSKSSHLGRRDGLEGHDLKVKLCAVAA